jgi:copper resistance protein D
MAIAQIDWLPGLLRGLIYAGTVLIAGGVLFRATFPRLDGVASALRWQFAAGAALLFVGEPLRYLLFQLQIAGGDLALALSPSMRWIGLETPLGQAAAVRLAVVVPIVLAGLRFRAVGIAAAIAMIGSYLLEGHTASSDERAFIAPLLFIHLLTVHWWIGALPALFATANTAPTKQLADVLERFGRLASWAVGALVVAGVIILGSLTEWHLDLASAYQQAMAFKLAAVVLILLLAAANKWRITPQIARGDSAGRAAFKASIVIEAAAAILTLLATALIVSFAPVQH